MTSHLRRRLAAFCALVTGLILLIGWSAVTAWHEVGALRSRFTSAQFESFRIAGQLQSTVWSLNSGLLAYEISGEEADWEQFARDSHALDAWIDLQRDALKTAEEKRVLAEIDAEYDRYLAVAQTIHREHGDPTVAVKSRVHQLETAAQRMLTLGGHLADAHRRALGDFLGESQRSLRRVEALFGAGCLVMLTALAWGTRVLFRETIAPLRTQLIETRALAERHEKLASLGVLAAGVAHEIRNPLTAIKTWVFTLQRKLVQNAPALDDAAMIDHEIDRLERIVRDFLLFARPGDPELATVVPQELLREVGELLSPELGKSGIDLIVESRPDGATLRVDPQQLKQVLINLVRNAAESIGLGGRITLRSRQDQVSLQGRRQAVTIIEVQDTGAGIPAEVQERLFDPFFTTKPTGTGLGLSIAMRILERHGGTLQFQTVPGHGTTFGLVLPLRPASQTGQTGQTTPGRRYAPTPTSSRGAAVANIRRVWSASGPL
ncbi:MAG: hypothetical protein QOE70_1462 [Chthoniobacter sp.]|jgi:signal transduction histidine kinase|nr:hypothetical protein [Chthoniobacter sp.]